MPLRIGARHFVRCRLGLRLHDADAVSDRVILEMNSASYSSAAGFAPYPSVLTLKNR